MAPSPHYSVSAATRLCAATAERRWAGKEYGPPQRYPCPKGRYDTMCHFSRPVPAQSSVRGIRKLVVSKCGLSVVRIFEIASSANQGRLWLVCRAQRDRVGTVDADETQLADRLGDGVGVN